MFAGSMRNSRVSNFNFNYDEVKTQFWGINCESGKQYSQVVDQRYHLTMAVLDPKSFYKDDGEKIVSLMVLRGGCEYLLCVLKHGEIYQVNLNLIFDKGENVVFYISGHGKVCLSGYQIIDPDEIKDDGSSVSQLKESNLSPSKIEAARPAELLKSVKSSQDSASRKIGKKAKAAEKNISAEPQENTPSKAFWNAFMTQETNGEIQVLASDDDEEDDKDFSIGDEDSDSEDEVDESEDDDEEDLKDEIEDLETEVQYMNNELEYLKDSVELQSDENESNDDEAPKPKVSQKRKKKLSQEQDIQKRAKTGNFASKPPVDDNSDDVICIDENEDSKDSSDLDVLNSSIGNTPMPKKSVVHEEASTDKKKKKKKKKLKQVLNTSQNCTKEPASKLNSFNKGTFQKLDNGLEIQDIKLGRGPEAVSGKLVHVYYLGRLPNNEVFDSRLPGKKPFSFKLGAKQVISGWEIGVQGMRVGGKRKIKVPPSLGYGSTAIEGVPSNSTLQFVIELQAVS